MASNGLHPAEHRGYRELYAALRQIVDHWSTVASSLGTGEVAGALEGGVEDAGRLLGELADRTAGYDLYGHPAAQALGTSMARGRLAIRSRALDRNQVLRLAVLDAVHVTTLLAYLAAVAGSRGDEALRSFCEDWERRMALTESAVRRAVVNTGASPDEGLGPLTESSVGRAAHGAAHAVGALGEWIDRRAARRGG
ncbi:MAG: hypothetical protein M3133_03110 [Actinomycetota bacterium]|nr:hypothetical protein [Actinomycetota bacterium]